MDPDQAQRLKDFPKAFAHGAYSLYEYIYEPARVLSTEAFLGAILAVSVLLWLVRRRFSVAAARGFLSVGVVLVLWELIPTLGLVNPLFFPSPTMVINMMIAHWQRGWLPKHIVASLWRFCLAFGLAVVSAIVVGFLTATSRLLGGYLGGVLYVIRAIPPPTWLPLIVLWIGAGNPAAILVVFLGVFFPVLIGTVDGYRKADPVRIDTIRTFGGGRLAVFREVYVPSSLPDIAAGIRIGFGIGWMMLVAAELAVSRLGTGLGWMITHARIWYDSAAILGGMVLISLLGLVLDRCLVRALRPWADLPTG
jgi:ABC-type nitrate/sulfonate/bicarbonate transport system permease component